jgi:hypothetical protein
MIALVGKVVGPPYKGLFAGITLGRVPPIKVVPYGAAITGSKFERIFLMEPPRDWRDELWVGLVLRSHLVPDGDIVHAY